MELHITCIPGDGIGPEIIKEAKKVLAKIADVYGHTMIFEDILMGGASIDVHGVPLTQEAIDKAKAADAVLMGSIGGNTTTSPWYKLAPKLRPEAGLLGLRKALNLFANLRPAVLYDELAEACPLKKETADRGIDLMIVRELTGGIYFGKRERYATEDRGEEAADRMAYSEQEIERIGRRAFELARLRNKKLASVDKANVLETSRLWRQVMHRLAEEYADVAYEDVLVDNAAMQLVRDPGQFDVVVTEIMEASSERMSPNMFSEIGRAHV